VVVRSPKGITMGIVDKIFPPKTTNVLDVLTEQHKQVDALLARLEAREGDRRATFAELANSLAAHAAAEEKIFYPAVMAKPTSENLHEAVEEHLAIKRLLADLLTMKVDNASFDAKLAVLKEQVSHHAHEEEEEKLFPMLRKLMTGDELAAIGNEYLVEFEALMESTPSKSVPGETAVAASLPPVR
jgi:hemerythrin superfamily protein